MNKDLLKPFNNKGLQGVVFHILDFRVQPKTRHRQYMTNKGKKRVYDPSGKNQSQFAFAMKKAIESSGELFKTLEYKKMGIMLSIRGCGAMRGDEDNYLKLVKDALQDERHQVILNDRQIKASYCEIVEKSVKNEVILYLKRLGGMEDKSKCFVYLSELIQGFNELNIT